MLIDHLEAHELKEVLVTPGFLTPEEFDLVISEAQESGKTAGQIILEKSYLTARELVKLAAEHLQLTYVDLSQQKISEDVLQEIPELRARELQAVAFGRDSSGLKVAFIDPSDSSKIGQLNNKIDHKVVAYVATAEDIQQALDSYPHHYHEAIRALATEASGQSDKGKQNDQALVQLVDTLIIYALNNRASDIHIEPYVSRLLIRFRVDGVLHHIIDLPNSIAGPFINRIKLLAKMKLDVRGNPQEGKISFSSGQFSADLRVTSAPVVTGEKIVLRLLSHRHRSLTLTDLGLRPEQLEIIKRVTQKKQGLIICAGPTGAGKTTTLYSLVKKLNSMEVDIATIEDPVEYDLEGINQIQVNNILGINFVEGLKVILRQDPDVIMIGAIRDMATASLAVTASLSGHLVLTSLDSSDVISTIIRLREMELETFLLATSLQLIIAQRLVRKICAHCRTSYDLSPTEQEVIAQQLGMPVAAVSKRLYRGKGCEVCGNTGFQGRVGVFEILEITEKIKKLLIANASVDDLRQAIDETKMVRLQQDAIAKIMAGLTTVDEVLSEVTVTF